MHTQMESASDAAQDAPSVAGVPVTGMHLLNYTITLQPNDCLSELLYFPDDAMYYVGRVHNTTALPSACGLDSFQYAPPPPCPLPPPLAAHHWHPDDAELAG